MSTLLAPIRPDTALDDLHHGAHPDCQRDRPTAKALCGVELPWDDMAATGIAETCVVCRDLDVCPICGAVVVR